MYWPHAFPHCDHPLPFFRKGPWAINLWTRIWPSCCALCSHVVAYSDLVNGLGRMSFRILITHGPFWKGPWVIKVWKLRWTSWCALCSCGCILGPSPRQWPHRFRHAPCAQQMLMHRQGASRRQLAGATRGTQGPMEARAHRVMQESTRF